MHAMHTRYFFRETEHHHFEPKIRLCHKMYRMRRAHYYGHTVIFNAVQIKDYFMVAGASVPSMKIIFGGSLTRATQKFSQ